MSKQRDSNRARVFEVIHLYEPITRAEIAPRVGLTSAAVSNIVSELLELGYIAELGRRSSVRGQPAIDLGVEASAAYTLGLHFEHGSISGVIADLKGNILHRRVEKLPALPSPGIVLDTLVYIGAELINNIPSEKLLGAGLASVGPIDLVEGSVTRTSFTTGWNDVPLRQPLAEALGLPVYMENNATAAAIGEYWYGVGHSYCNFMYISFYSNGLGGGLFQNRRVYRGTALNAAEFGHMLVQTATSDNRVPPYLENHVSGFALQRDLGSGILNELEQKLLHSDEQLMAWLDNASDPFAQAIVSADHLLDLDAIIVGGELPTNFLAELIRRVTVRRDALYMPGWSNHSALLLGQTGSDSAVLGAATLPIYDAFTPTSLTVGSPVSLFKSVVAGGAMH